MFIAITTKYFGPTNVRGSRIKASDGRKSLTVSWNHELGVEDNHRAACAALLVKLGRGGKFYGGSTETGYVFVCEHENPVVTEWAAPGT